MRRADELLPEAPKPKRGRPPKAKAQALANYDAGDVERPAGERWVTMSNALTRAGHGLTLAEKRIVAAAVSKLDSRKALPPGEVPRTKLTAMEYAETFGVDMNTAYDQLQAAAKQLYKRSITFYEPAHKRSGLPLRGICFSSHCAQISDKTAEMCSFFRRVLCIMNTAVFRARNIHRRSFIPRRCGRTYA